MPSDGYDHEPPYWRDAALSFLRTLASFLAAAAITGLGALVYYGVTGP